MDTIIYRSLQTSDADAVFAVAHQAWQFTYEIMEAEHIIIGILTEKAERPEA